MSFYLVRTLLCSLASVESLGLSSSCRPLLLRARGERRVLFLLLASDTGTLKGHFLNHFRSLTLHPSSIFSLFALFSLFAFLPIHLLSLSTFLLPSLPPSLPPSPTPTTPCMQINQKKHTTQKTTEPSSPPPSLPPPLPPKLKLSFSTSSFVASTVYSAWGHSWAPAK